MNKLTQHNKHLYTPIYRPSVLENLKQKHDYFEVQNIESIITEQNNPRF